MYMTVHASTLVYIYVLLNTSKNMYIHLYIQFIYMCVYMYIYDPP